MVNKDKLLVAALVVASSLLVAPAAFAQGIDESFRADIEKLLDATGSKQLGAQMAGLISRQMIDGMKRQQPNTPPRAIEIVQQVMDEAFAKAFTGPEGLTPRIVDIYARRFTPDEVRGLLAFYNTDLGKKVVTTMPGVVQESAAAGQAWATQRMPAVIATIQERLKAEALIK